MDLKNYIEQFNIYNYDDSEQDKLIYNFYSAILNKFIYFMDNDSYYHFKIYQEKIFDLIENLREHESSIILNVFDYLNNINEILPDIIILLWCLPRSDYYLSKKKYSSEYKNNIKLYNNKLISLIENKYLKNFCIDSLSKNNYIPVHCIDYIWFYMKNLNLEFEFYNDKSCYYIGISYYENNTIKLGLDINYIISLGLGNVIYNNINRLFFIDFFINIIMTEELIKKILICETKNNFIKQIKNIYNNSEIYLNKKIFLPDFLKKIIN